jgi:Domain of unknown function (DUF4350)
MRIWRPGVRTKHNGIIIAAIVLVAVAALSWWTYSKFEFYDTESELGYRGEARKNPYLAAGRLLEKYAAHVRFQQVYTGLPPPGATLLLPTPRRGLSKQQSERLREWAEAGGHLILVTWTLWDDERSEGDYLLDPLGVRQFQHEPAAKPGAAQEAPPLPGDQPRPVRLPRDGEQLDVFFDSHFMLKDASGKAAWALADDNGTHVLHYRVGRGAITALSDDRFLTNDAIEKYDHAALLVWLFEPKPGSTVWIVQGDDVLPLWRWLLDHAAPAVASMLALLVCWLWAASRRFGPALLAPRPERRSLVEHISASGRFLWREARGAALYQAVLDELRQRIRLRHPAWAELPLEEMAQRAATLSGMAPAAVRSALIDGARRREEDFVHDIQTLETLRKRL